MNKKFRSILYLLYKLAINTVRNTKTFRIMNFKQLKLWGILLSLAILTACGFQHTTNQNGEDFDRFYTKFHEDGDFQMERIDFPLKGTTTYLSEGGSKSTFWYKDDWNMHSLMSDTMDLNQNFISADSIMVDVIFDDKAVGLTRYFTLRDGKWYLTYYSEHNPIDPNFVNLK